ncbi:MAG: glyoxalase [Mesorhizobium amorphae]|nr:MAG: glyoxalase [Mesorhizobium amorphae]
MESRLSMVTLGTLDLPRDAAFYEALGFERRGRHYEGVAFFQLNGMALSLFPRADLATDAGVQNTEPGFSGVALAYNTRSEAEVDAVLTEAEQAGGRIVKPAKRAPWGGWSGYFADPSGHLWEVAFNAEFTPDAEGRAELPR